MDKIVFRIYSNGEVIALFPQIAASIGGYLCQSYMHVGQHEAADRQIVMNQTRLASRKEYTPLLKELEQIGYNPKPMKRFTEQDLRIRQEQAEKISFHLTDRTEYGIIAL